MGWLSGDWNKRIKLTIDQTKVDTANQLNFPVLVHLSTTSGITNADVSCVFDELTADGNRKKIAITLSDGTTECYVEIERWDHANEKAWLWVKVSSVAYDADTDLYLYYDSDHADNTTYVGDTTDAVTHNVWDSNFVGVWHMAQDPNGDAADAIKDSTSYGREGTPDGTMLTADLVDGEIGKAIDFDGNDDCIKYSSIDFGNLFTIETIVNPNDVSQIEAIMANTTGGETSNGFKLYINTYGTNDKRLKFETGNGSNADIAYSNINEVTFSQYQHIVGAINRTSGIAKLYINSSELSLPDDTIRTDFNTSAAWRLSNFTDDTYELSGKQDEVRISNIIRSAPWIKATYYSNFDNLVTFGSEEIITATNLLDGKIRIKSVATGLLDGKALIANLDTDLLDGKIRLKSVDTNLLDGKAIIKSSATNLLDGKVAIKYSAINLLDGKAYITYTGQIDATCPAPTCEMSAVFRYARLQASPPVPTASFVVGKIIEGDLPIPDFTCTAYHGRNPSLVAFAPCPACSMRVGLSLNDIATISQKAGVPIPTCIMTAGTHHLVTIHGDVPCPVLICDGDTVNITVVSASVPVPTGIFETTIGNVASILGRSPCPSCSLIALTGQVINLVGSVPVPGSLVRFYASLENGTITLEGTAPTPVMTSSVPCFASSVLRHVRGEIR